MKRRTLDMAFSAGGIIFSILLVVVGLILTDQKDFADTYVKSQLGEQQITFPPAEALAENTDEALNEELLEKFNGDQAKVDEFLSSKNLTSEASSKCLNTYAGQQMLTGKQAECYANEYIGLHLAETNEGKTYSETSGESRGVAAELEAAMEDDPESPETLALQAQSEELNAKVQTLFRGEALRGLLLTSYGFSIFGERAGQAALVAFLVAAVLALASIAGFVHAFTTPKEETVHLA